MQGAEGQCSERLLQGPHVYWMSDETRRCGAVNLGQQRIALAPKFIRKGFLYCIVRRLLGHSVCVFCPRVMWLVRHILSSFKLFFQLKFLLLCLC
mmetsp:Transcript_24542/g.51302  ORF Transcript_24542/g.51302 Transcript_24542/m.51302 type:complete len:95 (-) Transcript_24542:149-433(-)